jgi:DNA-binding LytR/AlgR family response regulator
MGKYVPALANPSVLRCFLYLFLTEIRAPMNWFLIIDDTDCKKNFNTFLRKYSASVLMKNEANKIFTNMNGILAGTTNVPAKSARIIINAAGSVDSLKIKDIVRCESQRSYTVIHLNDGRKLTVTKTLKQFELELTNHHFVRIHQSHLVNLNYVERFVKSKGGYAVLENGTELPVATRKKETFLKELEQL